MRHYHFQEIIGRAIASLSIMCLVVAFSAPLRADCVSVANLTAVEGQVSIKPAGKVLKVSPGPLPHRVCAGDVVYTFDGKARLDDGRSVLTMDRFSVVELAGAGQTGLKQGKLLMKVTQLKAASGVEVRTRLSTIGVKGTRFMVTDQNDELAVVLDEGSVEVASTQGPIALYREQPAGRPAEGEFDAFVRHRQQGVADMQAAFQAYQGQMQREFVAYVERLNLSAGKQLVTRGQIAVESPIGEEFARSIRDLGEWSARP